ETVNIALIKTTPELSKDPSYLRDQRNNNLLRWDVTIDPTMTGEKALAINYEFKLELDRQMTINSFQSTGSFGATSMPAHTNPSAPNPAPHAPMSSAEQARIKAALAKLSAEDRHLAEAQVFCAIDQESRLGSMGPILKVMVKGQPVFLCCKGCEAEAKS